MSFPLFLGSFTSHLPRSTASQANSTPHLPTGGPTLQDEGDLLDKEEADWYDTQHDVTSFGYNTLIPLGKQHTQEEDQDSNFSSSSRGSSPVMDGPGGLEVEDEEMEGGVDLDAEVEERDDNSTSTTDSEAGPPSD